MKSLNERVELRIPHETLKRWRVAAALAGLSLSAWIRQHCNESAIDTATLDRLQSRST